MERRPQQQSLDDDTNRRMNRFATIPHQPQPFRTFSLSDFPTTNFPQPPHRVVDPVPFTNNRIAVDRFPGAPQPMTEGHGVLTWLSPRAGVIKDSAGKSVSFQIKEFADQGLHDLLNVLRVGFILKYRASPSLHGKSNEYTASQVTPIHGAEALTIFADAVEMELEEITPTSVVAKEVYSVSIEGNAIEALLAPFQQQMNHELPLSFLHSTISNNAISDNGEVFRYVGTSSMKRRQFVERRTHLFILSNDDVVTLQHPAIYEGVALLSGFLLRRGGVTSIQDVYDFYTSPNVPMSTREYIGDDRISFMSLLTSHPFAFALFPNKTYVSARRNLPSYDYSEVINEYFPYMVMEHQPPQQEDYYQEQRHYQDAYGMVVGAQRPPRANVQNPLWSGYQRNPYREEHYNYNSAPNVEPWLNRVQQPYRAVGNRFGDRPSLLDERPPPLFNDHYSNDTLSFGSRTIRDPRSKQTSPTRDPFVDFPSEFGTFLSLADKSLKKEQQQPIGLPGCTCQCNCGEKKAETNGAAVATEAKKEGAETKSNGLGLPTILPGVSTLGSSLAPIGTRSLSNPSTSSSEGPVPFAGSSYNLFGDNDLLRGNLDCLRFNNK